MVVETCKRGIEHAKMCIQNEQIQSSEEKRNSVEKLLIEFYEMLFHQYATMRDIDNQLKTSQEQCEVIKECRGEMSTQYAEALYLRSKAQFQDPNTFTTIAFATIKKSLNIWKNTPLTGGPKDLNHAMALLMKATILAKEMQKYRWSIKVYKKATIIVSEITGARLNTEQLLNNILAECEKVI